MGLRDQTSIGLTPTEKEDLTKAKKLYEEKTGEKTDWGKFLGVAAGITLAVIGLRKIIQSDRNKPKVECPECGRKFYIEFDVSNICFQQDTAVWIRTEKFLSQDDSSR